MEEKDQSKAPAGLFKDLSSFKTSGKKLRKPKKSSKKAITTPRDPLYKIDESKAAKHLLIIDFQTDWYTQFKDCALKDGTPLIIEQTQWPLIDLEASSSPIQNKHANQQEEEEEKQKDKKNDKNDKNSKNDSNDSNTKNTTHSDDDDVNTSNRKIIVQLQPNTHVPNPIRVKQGKANEIIQFMPDFLLIRSLPTNIHGYDFMNILMGFMFANIPSINSLNSIFMTMQRCLVYAALNKFNNLPLIPMKYDPNFTARHDSLIKDKDNGDNDNGGFPKVVKVGNCHSGYGKSKIMNYSSMDDLKSILILNRDYYTIEKYISNIDFEYRIQKIGNGIRTFKRIQSDNWKTHISSFVEYKMTQKHEEWIDTASSIFGGLDICALDVLKTKDDEDIILELNDTAIGLMGAYEVEDESNIRDLVVNRMSQIWC